MHRINIATGPRLSGSLLVTTLVLVLSLTSATGYAQEMCNATAPPPGRNSYFSFMNISACDLSFDCLTNFCACTNGTNLTMCITDNISMWTLTACTKERVQCTIAAALHSVTSNETSCAAWATSLAHQYQLWVSDGNTSNLTQACMADMCSEVPMPMKNVTSMTSSCANFTPVLTTTAVPTTTMTTTPAPTTAAPPSSNSPVPVSPPATSVRVAFNGARWALVLANNRSALTTLVQSTIAASLNITNITKVKIMSLSIGSLVVLFQLLDTPNSASANAVVASSVAASIDVSSLNVFYQAAANTTESTSFGSAGVVSSDGTTLGHSTACGAACVGAIIGGTVLGVALVVGAICVCRARFRNVKRLPSHISGEYDDPRDVNMMRCPTATAANGQFGRLR